MAKTFDDYKRIIEDALVSNLPAQHQENQLVFDAMQYSLTAGGKRIRPALLLAAVDYIGGDIKDAIPYACALEYIHTYSLIHDDLPAMDNDDLRRGKPTNHKVYGEAMAILAGDGLLNTAFEIMSRDIEYRSHNDMDTKGYIKAMRTIATAAGVNGMIGGQTADITKTGSLDSLPSDEAKDILKYIHENKTGKLIEAAVVSGLQIAGASEETIEDFTIYAYNLGLAFQIADDILDQEGKKEDLGKTIGKDEKDNKITYVSIYGLDKAKELLEITSRKAANAIEKYNADFFINLVYELEKRKS